ncbi:MAG: hypothetical protein PF569_03110 [Candidatus Woesearchaeota archaeon]|jgi:hypothetical protein|nr:hypothetical protein [Candidatus Woesearchaeota archaeon]
MIKKNILLIFLSFLILLSGVYAQDCYFKTYDSTCERISTSKNTFQIEDISSQNLFDRYEVEIYETKSPDNKISYETQDLNINQITPFLEPGVYTVEVKAYDKSNNYKSKKFEYIFDNLEPMPPIVPIDFNVVSNSASISGKATPNSNLFVENAAGQQISQISISEIGGYDLTISNLAQGLNYLKFYVIDTNGKTSQIVERVVINGQGQTQVNPAVSSISISSNLASLNSNTIYDSLSTSYKTTKRNFYVQGMANGGANALVYINGIRTLADSNELFGGFVILNEGLNEIEVIVGDASQSIQVEYQDIRFKFLEVDYDKVTQDSITVSGQTNIDYPFLVVVNGEVLSNKIFPNSNSFNFIISNLQDGKNFIELRGINSQRYDFIVYKDVIAPTANIIETDLTKADKLIFEIKDDIGVNILDLNLRVDSVSLEKGDLKVKNNFYIFDISGISESIGHSYLLEGTDISGRTFAIQGNFEVDTSKTAIEDIYFDDGELIGNKLFVKQGDNRLNILPSKNIAFKSIYLDEVEQIDYQIYETNIVKLNLDIKESQGTLRLEFIDVDRNIYTKEYNYYAPTKEPQIDLDYTKNARAKDYVTLSGEIMGEYIDWLTLAFNDQENFLRYGNHFESIIDLTKDGSDNLNIIVSDYAGNSYTSTYGSLLHKDSTKSIIVLNQENINNSLKGSITNQEDSTEIGGGNLNFVNSYDGYSFNKLYLSADSFELPLSQRTGYRTLSVKGYEKSGERFDSNVIFKVDYNENINLFDEKGLAPIIYFNGNDKITDKDNYFIQGNIKSSTSIKSVTHQGSACTFDSTSFVCHISNLNVGENIISVDVVDNTDKRVSKDYVLERIQTSYSAILDEIKKGENTYPITQGYYLFGDEFDALGSIAGDDLTISVLVGGEEILYNNQIGQLDLNIDFTIQAQSQDKANLNVQIKAEDKFGNVVLSEKIKVFYRRVVESLTRVLVK